MSWRREPLVHFLLFGALLFVVHGILRNDESRRRDTIVVSRGDVQQLWAMFQKQRQRPPTPEELQGLVENRIREEVLYREALAMGLDRDDAILRRRMVQKLEFLSEDLANRARPTDEDLETYLLQHAERFRIPPRRSFRQVFLSPEKRGEGIDAEARQLLETLQPKDAAVDWEQLGDPTLLPRRFDAATQPEVARNFGDDFASRLFSLEGTGWQGPLDSTYGVHLVFLERRREARQPGLQEVREEVLREFEHARRQAFRESFYRKLLARYDVQIEPFDVESDSSGVPAAGPARTNSP